MQNTRHDQLSVLARLCLSEFCSPAQLHLQHQCGMAKSGVNSWTWSSRLEAKAQFPAGTITGKT